MSAVPDSILFISFETVSVIFPPHNSEYAPTGIEQSAFKVLITHRSVSKALKVLMSLIFCITGVIKSFYGSLVQLFPDMEQKENPYNQKAVIL